MFISCDSEGVEGPVRGYDHCIYFSSLVYWLMFGSVCETESLHHHHDQTYTHCQSNAVAHFLWFGLCGDGGEKGGGGGGGH